MMEGSHATEEMWFKIQGSEGTLTPRNTLGPLNIRAFETFLGYPVPF
jgi:hypothetical protein